MARSQMAAGYCNKLRTYTPGSKLPGHEHFNLKCNLRKVISKGNKICEAITRMNDFNYAIALVQLTTKEPTPHFSQNQQLNSAHFMWRIPK
jgi:hypothetical protein